MIKCQSIGGSGKSLGPLNSWGPDAKNKKVIVSITCSIGLVNGTCSENILLAMSLKEFLCQS